MLRDLMINENLAVDATFVAKTAMTTGMAVVKNFTDETADFPSAETASELFFVHKERIPTGISASLTEFSDWYSEFNTVAAGEGVVLYEYPVGSTFGTDAYATGLTNTDKGKVLSAGTDGKLKVATTTTVSSRYKFLGLYTEGTHTLAKVYVLENAVANS